MGGFAFCISMLLAQIFPFVALQLYDEDADVKDALTVFLVGSFSLWVLLNVAFFATIDLRYMRTFFGTQTAPQYTCDLYRTGDGDECKWEAVFENRLSYTKNIHAEVKEWVAENIARWERESPDWFKIEMIPDEYVGRENEANEPRE